MGVVVARLDDGEQVDSETGYFGKWFQLTALGSSTIKLKVGLGLKDALHSTGRRGMCW